MWRCFPQYTMSGLSLTKMSPNGVCPVSLGRLQHQELPVELAGEEHAVAVVGQERVLQLLELDEILRAGDADGRAVVAVAPGHVVDAVHQGDAGVVGVLVAPHLGIVALEIDRLGLERPLDAVGAPAHVKVRHPIHTLGPEHADELAFEGHHRAVVDARDMGQRAAPDHRVLAEPPQQVGIAGSTVLPGDIR